MSLNYPTHKVKFPKKDKQTGNVVALNKPISVIDSKENETFFQPYSKEQLQTIKNHLSETNNSGAISDYLSDCIENYRQKYQCQDMSDFSCINALTDLLTSEIESRYFSTSNGTPQPDLRTGNVTESNQTNLTNQTFPTKSEYQIMYLEWKEIYHYKNKINLNFVTVLPCYDSANVISKYSCYLMPTFIFYHIMSGLYGYETEQSVQGVRLSPTVILDIINLALTKHLDIQKIDFQVGTDLW